MLIEQIKENHGLRVRIFCVDQDKSCLVVLLNGFVWVSKIATKEGKMGSLGVKELFVLHVA
jgi:hypothetical protein